MSYVFNSQAEGDLRRFAVDSTSAAAPPLQYSYTYHKKPAQTKRPRRPLRMRLKSRFSVLKENAVDRRHGAVGVLGGNKD